MLPTLEQRLKRLYARTHELRFWIDRAYLDLDGWSFNGQPIALGAAWPTREGMVTFTHPGVDIPGDWPLDDVRLDLSLGGEGLVRLEYSGGDTEPFGLDTQHKRFPLKGRQFAIEVDAGARLGFGAPNRDARLAHARLVLVEPSVERLVLLLRLIHNTATELKTHDVTIPLIEAGERALNILHWPSETWEYIARVQYKQDMQSIWKLPAGSNEHPPGLDQEAIRSVVAASEQLDADLANLLERFPHEGKIGLSGHAHLDLAWLWPLAETRRKACRTYSTITGLLDRHPDVRFNQSSAQIYAFVEEDDPQLFERIRGHVEAGRWEPVGGMWVEPDINMPAGESLVRQLLYGQRYFQRMFGSIHRVCWLPDCFGFSPALPQLLRGAGIDSFFTIKLTWSETNTFPYDLFWWEGIDGSRVLAHMFHNVGAGEIDTDGYNGTPHPHSLVNTWRNFRGKSLMGESLLSIGYGDGGGGVTPEMIQMAREVPALPAIPQAEFTLVHDFYERLHRAVEGQQIPTWLGEMYLELHRGTLTSQGRTKYLHRRAERDLVAAEVLSSMAHLLGAEEPRSLEPLWRLVLRNEFHDILPGSSIREVYEVTEAELSSVVENAGTVMESALDSIAQSVVPQGVSPALLLVNPDLSPRPARIQVDEVLTGAQPVDGGSVVSSTATVPPLGALVLTELPPAGSLSVSERHLENDLVRVGLAEDGTLTSVFDKRSGREALSGRGNMIWAYVDKPPNWDAWDVDIGYEDAGEEITDLQSVEVIEHGPHRAAIRLVRRFRHSTITQELRLWAGSARLDIATTLDWHDRRWLLKARFPLAVRAGEATFESAFGVIRRPTHRNTSWEAARFEVVAHRFVDLSEPGFGVALLNDGKYGHHVRDNEVGISLLRAPTYPDPLADEGIQRFTYSLFPHEGDWLSGGVLMEAEDLNRPLLARSVKASQPTSWQALSIEGLQLGLGSLKVAEDAGGLVLRVYEPSGRRGSVNLALPSGWKADAEIDLLEREMGKPNLEIKPFQVRSWMLKHT